MTNISKPATVAKWSMATAAALLLAACNNPHNDGVRHGAQAVHPSGSALSLRLAQASATPK
ncbi:MAG: hypothetical protein V7763_16480 [Sulfitobacter sp.]|nr:MAG: hypothetical protein E8G75_13565 [Sulfitobacter sp. SK025]